MGYWILYLIRRCYSLFIRMSPLYECKNAIIYEYYTIYRYLNNIIIWQPRGIEMGPRASSAWRGVRRLCGMYKFTTNPSFGWDINKTDVPCWEIATLFARERTQCNSSLWALCSWWVVHRRHVALAKLSISTHYLSLFRVPWRLILF